MLDCYLLVLHCGRIESRSEFAHLTLHTQDKLSDAIESISEVCTIIDTADLGATVSAA